MDVLEKAVKSLPEPRNYFQGVVPLPLEPPTNLILFQRVKASALLGGDHHYHYRFVLIIAVRGEGTVVLDNRSIEMKAGEALLVFPHQFHHYHSVRPETIRWLFLTFEMSAPESLAPLRNRVNPVSEACEDYLARAAAQYQEMTRAAPGDAGRKDAGTAVSMLAGLALLELMRQGGRTSSRASAARPPVIDQINGYIWDNFNKDLNLGDLAERFHYSESHLRLLFRKRMGMSLGSYILKVKMNRARSLLISSGFNVSQAGQACGYDSLYSFSRAFKKSTGLSPLAYKKLNSRY